MSVIRERTSRARRSVLVGLLAFVVAVVASTSGVLTGLELRLVDARFAVRGDLGPPPDVVIVGIDDPTFRQLDLQWPFPRELHARVITALLRADARAVVYDVQFSERSTRADDEALLRAAANPRVVLSTTEVTPSGEPRVIGLSKLSAGGGRVGTALFPVDQDGVWRELEPMIDGLTHVAVLGAGGPTPHGARPIDFVGPPGTVREIPFWAVVEDRFAAQDVRGKIVIVGATAPSLHDVHATAQGGVMPGVEVIAQSIQTAIDSYPLRKASPAVDLLFVALAAMLVPLMLAWRKPGGSAAPLAAVGVLGAAGILVTGQVAFNSGLILAIAAPMTALLTSLVAAAGLVYASDARARRRFERYVSPTVAKELLRREGANPRLAGQRLQATVLFCDLRGFTSFAEEHDPSAVVAVLDRYLALVSDVILLNEGTVVSFQGDGVMAVFGAPLPRSDHAASAVSAASDVVRVVLPRLNAWLRDEQIPKQFRLGVGIHTGPVMCGSVGSEHRLEYAAVGDTTNVAARLQSLTDVVKAPIVLSESTQAALILARGEATGIWYYGDVQLRGRREGLGIFALDAT